MKRYLSERNLAGLLFIMVLIAFSLAHEDSKKKDPQYEANKIKLVKENPEILTAIQQQSSSAVH